MKAHINQILRDIGASWELIALELNDDNSCNLNYSSRLDVTLYLSESEEHLSIYAEMGNAADYNMTDLLLLLKSNFEDQSLLGSYFGVDSLNNNIVLVYPVDIENIDSISLGNTLLNFIDVAITFLDVAITFLDEYHQRALNVDSSIQQTMNQNGHIIPINPDLFV